MLLYFYFEKTETHSSAKEGTIVSLDDLDSQLVIKIIFITTIKYNFRYVCCFD